MVGVVGIVRKMCVCRESVVILLKRDLWSGKTGGHLLLP